MSSRHYWALVALGCVIAAYAGYRLSGGLDNPHRTPTYGAWLPTSRPIEPFSLTDSRDQSFTSANLLGHISLVYFGFTHCPDECPDTLALLARVRHVTGLPRLQVVFVSVDPRDTPAVLAHYLPQIDPRIIGLTGAQPRIDALAKALGVDPGAVRLPGGGYTFEHTLAVFLFDARGREAAVFTHPLDGARLAAALRAMAPQLLSTGSSHVT